MRARARRTLLVALGSVAVVLGNTRPAAAHVVERVVAVVDHRPILLSEVEHRARQDLIAKHQTIATPSDLKAALETMIDERAMQRAAAFARITVSAAEVDDAITNRAQMLGVSVEALWARTRAMGYSEFDYREMVRTQLLDGKLSAIWFTHPMHATPDEVWAAYERLRHDPDHQLVDLELLSLPVLSSASATEATVRNIVARARAGEDWCTLATRAMGIPACPGLVLPISGVGVDAVRHGVAAMNVGEISEPIRIRDRVVAFKLLRRVPPAFADVRIDAELDADLDLYTRLHREHVNELRRQASVEVRL